MVFEKKAKATRDLTSDNKMNLLKSNRSEGTPVWILIAVVLGIMVLVIVGIGVFGGFDALLTRLNIVSGSTLETVAQACTIACSSNSNTGYCVDVKTVKGLTDGQLEEVCKKVEPTLATGAISKCVAGAEGEVKGDRKPFNYDVINLKKKTASVVCNTLEEADLIDDCPAIKCEVEAAVAP